MRLTAALTGILLVAVVGVAAVEDFRSHRKVLQHTKPAAANETTATAPNEAKAAGAQGMHSAVVAVNATTAANTTGNATGNATIKGDGWGDGRGDGPRGPEYCYENISCGKRKLMQAVAASKAKAAGAESVNATVGAINATGLATANATNVTGNASGEALMGHGGWEYSGPGTHHSWTPADQIHCQLTGNCTKRRLLANSAESNGIVARSQENAPKATNITGNATSEGKNEETMGRGGAGDNGPVRRPGIPTPCLVSKCLKRKLMHTAATDTAATVANDIKAAGAEGVNATQGAVNASKAANASSNATGNSTVDSGGNGDGWGNSGRDPEPCYENIACRKRKLMPAATAANETKAAGAEGVNATATAVNATDAAAVGTRYGRQCNRQCH